MYPPVLPHLAHWRTCLPALLLLFTSVITRAQPPAPWLLCADRSHNHRLQGCLLVDQAGQLLSPTRFEVWAPTHAEGDPKEFGRLSLFRDGLLLFAQPSLAAPPAPRWGYVDTQGQIVVPPRYLHARPFSEARAQVCDDRGCGYIDPAGKEIIPLRPAWQTVRDFRDGRALVRGPSRSVHVGQSVGSLTFTPPWTVIDQMGQRLMGPDQTELIRQHISTAPPAPPQTEAWQVVADFQQGIAPIAQRLDQGEIRYGLVDVSGNMVMPPTFSRLEAYNGRYWITRHLPSQQPGLLERVGHFTAFSTLLGHNASFDTVRLMPESEGISLLDGGPLRGLLTPDLHYQPLLDLTPQDDRVREGLLPVRQFIAPNPYPGCHQDHYLNRSGQPALPGPYLEATGFSEGLAAARPMSGMQMDAQRCWQTQTPLGFINPQGQWVIPPRFLDIVTPFRNGRAIVLLDDLQDEVLIDPHGTILARYRELVAALGRQ